MFDILPSEINYHILKLAVDGFEFASGVFPFLANALTVNKAAAAIVSSDVFLSDALQRFHIHEVTIKDYVSHLCKKRSIMLEQCCPCGCNRIVNTYNIFNVRNYYTELQLLGRCKVLCGIQFNFVVRGNAPIGCLLPVRSFMDTWGNWSIVAKPTQPSFMRCLINRPRKIQKIISVPM